MFGLSPRDLKRQLKRLGIKLDVEELEDARNVTIELPGKMLVIDDPQVVIMRLQGQTIFYIMGEPREVEIEEEEVTPGIEISEEDVQLVASQAGVSLEEARRALEASEGDLAKAIMLLESKKRFTS